MKRKRKQGSLSRPGFIAADILGGLLILAVLTMGVAGSLYQHQQAMRKLGHQRQAVTLAERAIATVQAGQPLPKGDEQTTYELVKVEGGENLPQHAWVRLTVAHRTGRTELIAVVSRKALEGVK